MKRCWLMPIAFIPTTLLAAAAPVAVQPGQWTTRVDITDVQIPGAPAMLARLFARHPQKWSGCVSAAEAAKGVPLGTTRKGDCTVTRTAGTGGRFTAYQLCTQPDETAVIDVTGIQTPTRFTAAGTTVVTGKRPMTLKMTMTGQRTGAC